MATPITVADLAAHVRGLATTHRRYIVGIAGSPGSGKSTIAAELGALLDAPTVPMDGFHMRNAQLDAAGLRGKKGAPQTFDGGAFVDLLLSLRAADRNVRAPSFDRELDEPLADTIAVPRRARIVIVEGNYLLLGTHPWHRVAPLLDIVAWVDLDESVRRERLVARHVQYGRTTHDAVRFVDESDEPNARLVAAGRDRADVVVRASGPPHAGAPSTASP